MCTDRTLPHTSTLAEVFVGTDAIKDASDTNRWIESQLSIFFMVMFGCLVGLIFSDDCGNYCLYPERLFGIDRFVSLISRF